MDRKKKEREIAETKGTISGLNAKVDKVDKFLDHEEQYSKRNCLLIHGFDEENQGNTDEVVINILKKRK